MIANDLPNQHKSIDVHKVLALILFFKKIQQNFSFVQPKFLSTIKHLYYSILEAQTC